MGFGGLAKIFTKLFGNSVSACLYLHCHYSITKKTCNMKTFKNSNQMPIKTINGKNAAKVVKSSKKQFEKVLEPFIYNNVIIDSKTLESGKVYRDITHGHVYFVGINSIFQIEEDTKHYFKPSELDIDTCEKCGSNFRNTDAHISNGNLS